MSSPYAGGGCRVRDLASCFLACRISLDEEEPDFSSSKSPPKTPNRSIAPESRHHGAKVRTSETKKRYKEHTAESVQSSSHHNCGGGCRAADGELHFAEEDYIVFCFGEDGDIQMINEAESSETYTRTSSEAATSQPCISRKGGEIEEMDPSSSKMDSFESCDSNLSGASRSSFAFPELGMEWIGSPIHLPNTEKRNTPSLSRCCCRFVRRLH